MNFKVSIYFIVFITILLNNNFQAQNSYQFGVLPSLNLNKNLKKDWSLNSKLESRMQIQEGQFNGVIDRDFKYVLTDISLSAAKKVGLNSRVAGGYLIRFRDDEIIHRTLQQFSIVQKMSSYRIAHRLVSDQTFSSNSRPEFRFRYRLTFEIPLNGQSVDPKEFYVKLNSELLNAIQSAEYDLEVRVVPFLGYNINSVNKFEVGLDYRVNSFLNNMSNQSFWMSVNWFVEF